MCHTAIFVMNIIGIPYGANARWGKILTNLMNQSSIVKIFPINILHFNKII